MIIRGNKTVRKISANISLLDIEVAKAYIQGAVHSDCNNKKSKELSVRSLFGGDNGDWHDTPLQHIYDYHKYISCSKKPEKEAAKDVGWLLKSVLVNDKYRRFECVKKETGCVYLFCGFNN